MLEYVTVLKESTMKRLLLTLLIVACFAATSFAEEGQVVVIRNRCVSLNTGLITPECKCTGSIKNIGNTDVYKVSFKLVKNANEIGIIDDIEYVPAHETTDFVLENPFCEAKEYKEYFLGAKLRVSYEQVPK